MSLTLKGVAEARNEPSDCTHEPGNGANPSSSEQSDFVTHI